MFGLDHQIASLNDGAVLGLVVVVAILLGLRHASDPDHLTAVTALVAGEERDTRGATRIGFAWGLGHATSLFVFGIPIVLLHAYLPETLQMGAEAAVGVLIILLALRLLWRWRRGPSHAHARGARTRRQAYGIGLVHGMGGSAGVGVLLLAAIPGHVQAAVALALFATFTAVSMALASTSFGWLLARDGARRSLHSVAPAIGALSLAFGVWYALGAVEAVPYVF